MPWTWGDAIDLTTDLQDTVLWNQLLAAVHERGKVSWNPLGEDWANAPPTNGPGLPDVRYPVEFDHQDDWLKQGTGGDADFPTWNVWLHKSIYEMQQVLEGVMIGSVKQHVWPTLEGATEFQVAFEITYDNRGDDLADRLGYVASEPDPDDAFGHPLRRLWRRKSPRIIANTTATHNLFNTETPCEVGALAQLYLGGAPSAVFIFRHTLFGGAYQGVLQLRDTGTWDQPDDTIVGADILDSDNPYYDTNWRPPGRMGMGIYYEVRLLSDIVAACKEFGWRHFNANATLTFIEGGDNFTPYPSAAAAMAAATAQLIANITANNTSYISGGFFNDAIGSLVSQSGANYFAMLRTARVTQTVRNYKNIQRAVDWYLSGGAYEIFNAQGTAILNGAYHKFATTAETPSGHTWANDVSGVLINYPIPTAYSVGHYVGFKISEGTSVTKFDFQFT